MIDEATEHTMGLQVRRQGQKVVVTFKDQRSADRFAGLAYVKYRGVYINRAHYKEEPKPVQKPAQPDRRAEKRKLEPTPVRNTVTPGRATVTPGKDGVEKKSVQFKLKGVFGEGTGYRDIKAVLEQEHGLDVRWVPAVQILFSNVTNTIVQVRVPGGRGGKGASAGGRRHRSGGGAVQCSAVQCSAVQCPLGGVPLGAGPGEDQELGAGAGGADRAGGGRPHQGQGEGRQCRAESLATADARNWAASVAFYL
jgi:hypothetical protein